VKLTSTMWGGRFNPIIPVGGNTKLSQDLISMFNVDILLPISEGTEIERLIQNTKYLPWSDSRREMFLTGTNGPMPVFLDVFHPLRQLSEVRKEKAQTGYGGGQVFPNLLSRFDPGNDAISDALLCTLGAYPAKDQCPIDYGALADRLVGSDNPFVNGVTPDYWDKLTPLTVTRHDLLVYKRGRGWDSPGVFIGDPALFSDLVSFWNLRAAGIEVLFVADAGHDALIAGAQAWVEKVKASNLQIKPSPFERPAAWSLRHDTLDWAMHNNTFGTEWVRHNLSESIWDGQNIKPSQVHFAGQSALGTLDESDGKITVAFSLPPKPLADNSDYSYEHAMVTIRPLLDPNPTIGTFRYPNIPQLNEFYGRNAHFDYSKARIESDGLSILIRTHESDLRLRGIPPLKLAAKFFSLAGIDASLSSAGKVALRVIHHMGGIDSCRAFKISGVRQLLNDYSLTKHFSHSQALARIGKTFDPFKGLHVEQRDHKDLTPQDVFLHLVKKKVFRPGIELECTNCLLKDWHSLNDLDEQVSCSYCGSMIDSGPQLRDGAWQYRVSGVFARTRDHEGAIPVALALIQTMRILHHGMTWLTGTELMWTGLEKPVETDLVVIAENYEHVPQLVIGECKTNMQITAEQLDKLLAVAARFADTGIKVFIMLAKAGVGFTEEEILLIDDRQTIELNFILLTPIELEPYEPYENAKVTNMRHRTPLTLEEWAEYSRRLYLRTTPEEILKRFLADRETAKIAVVKSDSSQTSSN